MLKIFGVPISRSISNIWAALELGIDYENVPIGWDDNSIYSDAYRRINPNSRVPAIQDDDFIMWESLAINWYLVKKYDRGLAPKTLREEARALQWTLWAATQLEKPAMEWAFNAFILEEKEREASRASKALDELRTLLAILERELADKPYLIGDRFSIADLNVGCVLLRPRQQLELSEFPHVRAWDRSVFDRPAAKKAWRIRVAATRKK